MAGEPRISVVIPTFQREAYVLDAVDSVLKSDLPADQFEIIVVADGLGKEIESQLEHRGVQILHPENATVGEFLAAGVSTARAEIVAFLDDDDIFNASKLRTAQQIFADPNIVYYHHGFRRVDANGVPMGTPLECAPVQARFALPLSRGEAGWIRRKGGCYNTSSICVRKSALDSRLATLRQITNAQDFSLLILLSGPGEVLIDGTQVLSDYRTHVSQGTHLFSSEHLSPAHVRFLEGTVRSFERMFLAAPTSGAKQFARCRAASYGTLLRSLTGRSASASRRTVSDSVRSVVGNLREGDIRSAAILASLVYLSTFSHDWALRFYIPLKRIELSSLGVKGLVRTTPAPAA